MVRLPLLIGLLASCNSSTVSEPLQLRAWIEGVEGSTVTASLPLQALRLRDCDCLVTPWTQVISATSGNADTVVTATVGPWCWGELSFDGPITVEVEGAVSMTATLDPEYATFDVVDAPTASTAAACTARTGFGSYASVSPLTAPTPLILELGPSSWVAAALTTATSDTLVIDSSSNVYDTFVQQIQSGSALYLDTDLDGLLSADERVAGAVATGTTNRDDMAADSGG